GGKMRHLSGIALLISISGHALAADQAVPQRPRPQQRAEPAVQQQANWSGTQVGGFNGASSVSNSFAEPGSNLFFSCIATVCPITPAGFPDLETPFGFEKDKWTYTFGAFLGHRWQFGSLVTGIEGDVAYKTGKSQQSLTVISRASYHAFPTAPPFEV